MSAFLWVVLTISIARVLLRSSHLQHDKPLQIPTEALRGQIVANLIVAYWAVYLLFEVGGP